MKVSMVSESFSLGMNPVELHGVSKKSKSVRLSKEVSGGDSARVLDANVWLPAAAKHYHISPDLGDYILVPLPTLISEIPNTNGDSLSLKELVAFNPSLGQLAYQTWRGKPVQHEHCFPAGTPIQTSKGLKPIDKIKLGDSVLTHKNRFRKVTELFDNGSKWVSSIKCQGLIDDILVTENHPLWVIDQRQFYNKVVSGVKQSSLRGHNEAKWSELRPHFRAVSDIYRGDYLCVPITIGGDISVDKDFAFLTGIHMAEGSYDWRYNHAGERVDHKPQGVYLTICITELTLRERIMSILDKFELTYKVYHNRKNNTTTLHIKDKDFATTMYDLTGNLSHERAMKGELRQWNKEALKWFLGGYISGDGCVAKQSIHTLVRCRTASKALAYDIWHAMSRLGIITRANYDAKPKTYTYFCPRYNKERTIHSKGSYVVSAADWSAHILSKYTVGKLIMEPKPRGLTQFRIMLRDNYILVPVSEIKHKVSRRKVFNFEVEDDHSYVAAGVVAHNCNKDITKAKGVILDVYLKKIHGFNGNHVKLIKLLAIDRTKDVALANSVLNGDVNTYSLGMYFNSYVCSICGNRVTKSSGKPCSHTTLRQRTYQMKDGRLAYRMCEDIQGFETSIVKTPAYVVATSDIIMDARKL